MTDRNDMSNEDPCLHFEAKLVSDLRTKIKKRLIAAICDLKQPCQLWQCVRDQTEQIVKIGPPNTFYFYFIFLFLFCHVLS